jgi:hypothetical protein
MGSNSDSGRLTHGASINLTRGTLLNLASY